MVEKRYRVNKTRLAEFIAGMVMFSAAIGTAIWFFTHMYW